MCDGARTDIVAASSPDRRRRCNNCVGCNSNDTVTTNIAASTNPNACPYVGAYADIDSNTDTDTDANSNSYPYAYAGSNRYPSTNANADSDAHAADSDIADINA